jgi:hypothetical protein
MCSDNISTVAWAQIQPAPNLDWEVNENKPTIFCKNEFGFAEAKDSKAKAIYATSAKEPVWTNW